MNDRITTRKISRDKVPYRSIVFYQKKINCENSPSQTTNYKPKGLWYSIRHFWLDFIINEMMTNHITKTSKANIYLKNMLIFTN